jgi:hypothetical protein
MSNFPVPTDVREYITDNIDSVAELEALVLMRRDPEVVWSASALAERLYVGLEQAGQVALKLCSLGVTVEKGRDPVTYQYRPARPGLDTLVGEVVDAYTRYLIPVTNLIHSKPQTRVQQFAEAFKLRKQEDD